MKRHELEEDVIISIEEDSINDFMRLIKNIDKWDSYILQEEQEYFIHYSIRFKAYKIINFIIEECVHLNVKNSKGETSLHLALIENMCQVVECLINKQCEFCPDANGNNELHKWLAHNCNRCWKALLKCKKEYNLYFTDINSIGNSSLHQSVIDNNLEGFNLLQNNFPFSLGSKGVGGNNILLFAAMHCDVKFVTEILQLKIDINSININKETALTLALINRNFQLSEKLLDDGIKIYKQDVRLANETSNLKLYNRLKNLFDIQQKNSKARSVSKNRPNPTHAMSEEGFKKDSKKDSDVQRMNSMKKPKQSENLMSLLKRNIDSNKSETNSDSYFEKSNSSNFNSKEKSLLIPFKVNSQKISFDLTNSCTDEQPFKILKENTEINANTMKSSRGNTYMNFSQNLSNMKTPNEITNKSSIFQISGEAFCKEKASEIIENSRKLSSYENLNTKQKNTTLNKLNIDNLINFEYLKSFTQLEFKDIHLLEKFYAADICDVWRAKYKGLIVAVKVYNISRLTEEYLKYFISEVNLLISFRHPNIVTFIGTCLNKNDFYLVTEYLEKESLKKVIEDFSIELTLKNKLKICLDIAVAIYYLHSRNPKVFHRDLKSSNCLVDKFMRVKLCDFGLSKIYDHFTQLQTNSSSTCFWMAPEFIMEGVFTDKADIYSFGILIWEVIMRDTKPFKGIKEITFLIGDKEILKRRPVISSNVNPEVRELIESCWEMDYNKRPDIAAVVEKLESLVNKL